MFPKAGGLFPVTNAIGIKLPLPSTPNSATRCELPDPARSSKAVPGKLPFQKLADKAFCIALSRLEPVDAIWRVASILLEKGL